MKKLVIGIMILTVLLGIGCSEKKVVQDNSGSNINSEIENKNIAFGTLLFMVNMLE